MGSVESFEVFFRRVLPHAVAAAQRVTSERASAEDAAVEALTKAHLRWSYLAGEAWRDLWVVRVSVNEAIRHLPRAARPVTAAEGVDLAEMVATREMLGWALAALPRRQREVVVLRHLVGLSEVEVARALEISHGTVKTHLRRGMAVLRLRLEPDRKERDLAPALTGRRPPARSLTARSSTRTKTWPGCSPKSSVVVVATDCISNVPSRARRAWWSRWSHGCRRPRQQAGRCEPVITPWLSQRWPPGALLSPAHELTANQPSEAETQPCGACRTGVGLTSRHAARTSHVAGVPARSR